MKRLNIDEYILQNYKTKTNAQMALECGCNKSTISNHRKKLGISATEFNKSLREKTDYICKLYGRKTAKAIAEELSCSKEFIKKIWSENGLTGTIKTTYYCDETYFDNIDSPQKAYFLGFIAADGNIYRRDGHMGMLSLSVKDYDIEVLNSFKEELDTTKPISLVADKRRSETIMATLQLTNDQLCNQLLDKGIGIRKTFDLSISEICSHIPVQFWNSFILGYFDGDGSIDAEQDWISRSHVRIVAPIKSLKEFQEILSKFDINGSIVEEKRTYKEPFGSLEFKNTTEKFMFLKFIYSSTAKCLERKKLRADKLLKRIEDNDTGRAENVRAQEAYKSVVLKWGELLGR